MLQISLHFVLISGGKVRGGRRGESRLLGGVVVAMEIVVHVVAPRRGEILVVIREIQFAVQRLAARMHLGSGNYPRGFPRNHRGGFRGDRESEVLAGRGDFVASSPLLVGLSLFWGDFPDILVALLFLDADWLLLGIPRVQVARLSEHGHEKFLGEERPLVVVARQLLHPQLFGAVKKKGIFYLRRNKFYVNLKELKEGDFII